jgi:thiol-disulfide isomerase/thioredoxin
MQISRAQSQRLRGMDRLSSVRRTLPIVALAGVVIQAGCKGGSGGDTPPPRRRVDAVEAPSKPKVDLAGFCDERPSLDEAKTFAMPALDGKPMGPTSSWRWINVWATWCKPCVEELPLLAGWRTTLERDRVPLDIVFLSVDESADLIEQFRTTHPETPASEHIAEPDALAPWLEALGLGESTALPIQLFVDPDDKLRCVRLGQVSERDYDTVVALVREG